jgi:hypothetical protein
MLFMMMMYFIGFLTSKVKNTLVLAIACGLLYLLANMAFGVEFPRAGTGAAVYLLLGFAWLWGLEKASDTIFMWFVILLPGPIAINFVATVLEVAMFGKLQVMG